MNEVETQFNALYQKTLAFYENAMNGDKTHPFVLFKIKQLKLKKSNFKKVKDIDNDLLASTLRTILLEDLQTFVEDVKEYEMKMKAMREAKKLVRPPRQNNNRSQYRPNNVIQRQTQFNSPPTRNPQYQPTNKPVNPVPKKLESPSVEVKKEHAVQTKKVKTNQKYLRSMNFKNNSSKKKGKR